MQLFCMAISLKRSAVIDIQADTVVVQLHEAIKEAMALSCDPANLELYLAKEDGDPQGAWLRPDKALQDQFRQGTLARDLEETYLKSELRLRPRTVVSTYFGDVAPPMGSVHLLVDTRRASIMPRVNASSPQVTDTSSKWLESYQGSLLTYDQLPSIQDLGSFIKQRLPTKIAIAPSTLAAIRRKFDARSPRDVLEKLFVEDHRFFCQTIGDRVVNFITNVELGTGTSSEASFHFLWDSIIRATLTTVFMNGSINREPNTSWRPDFTFTLHSVCVFRGEEDAPGVAISKPRDELHKNLVWAYGGVPYILAYAASGYECRLFALWQRGSSSMTAATEIGEFHLQHMADRFCLLLALLQLGRLFDTIALRCPRSGRAEHVDVRRRSGEIIWLDPIGVRKDFSAATSPEGRPVDFHQVAGRARHVYDVLTAFQVPNVDSLVSISGSTKTIALRPRGVDSKPATLADLFCALRHVLEALVALHRASWMHRDIQWPNVLKRREEDGGGWFLIDFMDAAPSPQVRSPTVAFTEQAHAPEMLRDGGAHTTAVDLWSVGYLINTSSAREAWLRSEARRSLKARLLHPDPAQRPTAEEALREVLHLNPSTRTT